ncbi:MAG: hypothetical protein JXJ20_02495 [Anaerolineae bacterium]|nr:hypothetical protein [Anaerolineae bacterium]
MADTNFPTGAPDNKQAVVSAAGPGRARVMRELAAWFGRADVLIYALLGLVLLVAGWLRFDAQNWDDFTHLHPDERFLTDVVSVLNGPLNFSDASFEEQDKHRARCDLRYPASGEEGFEALTQVGRGGYFDADCSPLNPNNVGKGLYVYGEFPLFTVHAAGVAMSQLSLDVHSFLETFDTDAANSYTVTTHWEGYNGAQFVGRSISALADCLTVLVVFLLGRRLYGRWHGLLAAALYGLAAFPIQQSHFWTVDAFTTFWVTLALYMAVRALDGASVIRGPSAAAFLAVWAGGVTWEAATRDYPILGLVVLGLFVVIALAAALAVRAWIVCRDRRGGVLIGGAAVIGGLIVANWALARSGGDVINFLSLETGLYALDLLLGELLALVTVGILFGVALVLTLALHAALRVWLAAEQWQTMLIPGSAVVASVAYQLFWLGAALSAPHDFPLRDGLLSVGVIGLAFGAVTLFMFGESALIRRRAPGDRSFIRTYLPALLLGVVWGVMVGTLLFDGLSPLPVLFVAVGTSALVIFDAIELTDYALFGAALGGAVASRVNVAPLAGVIVVAAGIRVLPVFDRSLSRGQRQRIVGYALTGVATAAVLAFIVFRLLQPHAFMGPGLLGLRINPGWREDVTEAAEMTSGSWDAPPNHQWANRTPYWFPWRNIVLWGMGIPLGLAAWAAWAWAGGVILRGARRWTRHAIPFAWVLVCFGWLGGRWVTTMRYFLPIYPALALFAGWALVALVLRAWYARRRRPGRVRRWAFGGAAGVLVAVLGYTALYGFGFHSIERQQLTRVAASRWFFENVPGDFGIWIEGENGERKLVNIGRGSVADAPSVKHLAQGDEYEFSFTVPGDSTLVYITLHHLGDPDGDPAEETVRVRLFRQTVDVGKRLVFEDTITADFAAADSPYGTAYTLRPEETIELPLQPDPEQPIAGYVLQIAVIDGGPVFSVHGSFGSYDQAIAPDVTVGLRTVADHTLIDSEFSFEAQPILTGHGDDVPATPTHWTVGGSDPLEFTIPIDGVIRQIDIPHLGDPLRDAGVESLRLTLLGPDGQITSATLEGDFNAGADPLGAPQTVTFDPPLTVRRLDRDGNRQTATLVIEAKDPVYTAGPVIAWEGDWDDPVPWPVCPIPDDMIYRDDLPSGLSSIGCISVNPYGAHYQGLKLWMVAEDNQQKYDAMLLALDQSDYIVITSNRFYDSLTRIPMRWPMTEEYYKALFDGRLGFELVKTFESAPQIGPFTIPDQILPSDDLPDWLNDQWEAEEAFHVYDHPVVFVFHKTDAYTPDNTRAILDSVSLRTAGTAVAGYAVDPDPIGVVPWTAPEASKSPTMLQFTDDEWDIQRDGGTWSDLFDLDALVNRSETAAVIIWWALIVIAGWLAWPLLYVALPALPDRGFPAAKIAAWLLVAWIAWVGGTFKLLTWSRPGILLILVGLAVLSLLIIWRRRAEFLAYIRANWRHLLLMEALALVLFLVMLYVRLGNPDLWHGSFGGEKPMDFAYFNAVLRSTIFPPIDPWFAGGYMNYYYFGYVIVGAPVKLLGIQPSVAYNLILPALYAMTGVIVFSVAYNWVRSRVVLPGVVQGATRDSESRSLAGESPPTRREPRLPAGRAWLAGLAAVMLAMVLGNLGEVLVFTRQVAALDGWEQQPLLSQVRLDELEAERADIFQGFYDDESEAFRDAHDGRDPESSDEILTVTQVAQEKTDDYIEHAAKYPPLARIWGYGLENLRDQIGAFFGGLDDVLNGVPLQMHTHRWYWAPTRIIAELPGGAGHNAIAEMPYFTYLYGDLHAHMIAMPVTLLALLWLVSEIIGAGHRLRAWWESGLALGIGALAVGVLRPTNSWDWITYLILGAAGLTYVAWAAAVRANRERDLPPSQAAARVWDWLTSRRSWLLWPELLVIPLALVARVAYYFYQQTRADEQAERALLPGETLIDPSLTLSSVLVWALVGLALVIALYVVLLAMLRAYLDRRRLLNWWGRVALFVALAFVAAMPFTAYFATAYNSVKPWEYERTPLWAYTYVHGTFLFLIISLLVWQTARWLRRTTVRQFEGLVIPVSAIGFGLAGLIAASIYLGVREVPVVQLVVPLMAWATLLFFLPDQPPMQRAVYALIVLALAISVGVEVVVLDGDIGRQNTVFKFYLQVWFLLSVVGGITLAWMLRCSWRWHPALRIVWHSALAILFSVALMYPLLGTRARFLDRFNPDETPTTLDGMAYMQYAIHGEHGVWFKLDADYDMIRWLQDNIKGTPVVMEAHLYPSEYHWGGRISIYTGLPTVLGWTWHQRQQHTLPQMDALVQTRENNIAAFYELDGAEGIRVAWNLAEVYDVEYIVVGVLERAFYDDIAPDEETGALTPGHSAGLAKFDTMVEMGLLDVVYNAPGCLDTTIGAIEECPVASVYMNRVYRVVPGVTYDDVAAVGWPGGR